MEIIQIKVDVAGDEQALPKIQKIEKAVDTLKQKGRQVAVDVNTAPMENLSSKVKEVGTEGEAAAKKLSAGMQSIEKSTENAGKTLSQLFTEITKWQILNAAVAATIRTVTDAVDTMKAVDDELVTVRKVTGATADEMEKLKDRAYEVASAYGESSDE